MKGKPVYLEYTGEKLGIVFDMIYNKEKHLVGYKIKDNTSSAILSFTADQFDEGRNGLIFIPSWYAKAIKTLEKLEFKERVTPELTTLLTDNTISNKELYNIFVKHDDQMAKYIEDAVTLREMTERRLKLLEKQRLSLKENLMDLTEKRLIKDIDRRTFSEDVMKHRGKVNVLDVNISKCKKLLDRLNRTSFGKLGKQVVPSNTIEKIDGYPESLEELAVERKPVYSEIDRDQYKDKYYDMKQRFEQLEEDYNELKTAVGKLIAKDEL